MPLTEAVLIEVLHHIRHVLHMEAAHDVHSVHQLVDHIGLQVAELHHLKKVMQVDILLQLLHHTDLLEVLHTAHLDQVVQLSDGEILHRRQLQLVQ